MRTVDDLWLTKKETKEGQIWQTGEDKKAMDHGEDGD